MEECDSDNAFMALALPSLRHQKSSSLATRPSISSIDYKPVFHDYRLVMLRLIFIVAFVIVRLRCMLRINQRWAYREGQAAADCCED